MCDDAVTDLPYLNNEHFLESICKLVEERKIEYIIPTDDNSALVLTQLRDQIPAVIVCSPYETARICRYKSLTYERLAGEKYVPVTYSAADVEKGLPYPVFIKPDNSQGSRGGRTELATFNSPLSVSQLHLVWVKGKSLALSNKTGAGKVKHYYLTSDNHWKYFATSSSIASSVPKIYASRLYVRNKSGNLLMEKKSYSKVDLKALP